MNLRDFQQTSDNGYIILGSSWGSTNSTTLIKTDVNGNTEWQEFIPIGYTGYSFDNGFIISGYDGVD